MFSWTPKKALTFQLLGTLSVPIALYNYSIYWLGLSLAAFLLHTLVITVGLHRLFAHGSFKCSRAWQCVIGYFSCLPMVSSPIQWAAVHYSHHKHSDSPEDPHNAKWAKILGTAGVPEDVKVEMVRAKRLLVDPLHKGLHRYYLLVVASWVLLLYVVGGAEASYFGWVLPTVAVMWLGAHHNRKAHVDGKPTNMPNWMGWVYFGEHLHKNHHDKPGVPSFSWGPRQIDVGYMVIKAIANEPLKV